MSWVSVPGYEGRYAISDDGEVMSMNYAKSGLPGLMTPGMGRGYLKVGLRHKGEKEVSFTIHRLVAAAFIGPRPKGMHINHKDGNKLNNHVSNLEYVTPSENQKHACRLHLIDSRGEKHSQSKLTELQVMEILVAISSGEKTGDLAIKYDVHQSQISHIKAGRAWPHLERKVG